MIKSVLNSMENCKKKSGLYTTSFFSESLYFESVEHVRCTFFKFITIYEAYHKGVKYFIKSHSDLRKGPFKYYVIMFLTFLGPPTSLMIYSTVNHQKLPFSDPTHPPL